MAVSGREPRPAEAPAPGVRDGSAARRSSGRAGGLALLCAFAAAGGLGWGLYLHRDAAPPSARGARAAAPRLVDVGFSQAMSVHHHQAIEMAQIVLRRRGASSNVRALASDIQTTQLQEVGTMVGWLNLWGAPTLPPADQMGWMTTNAVYYCGLHRKTMPGLARQPELNELAAASGRRLDVLFLQLMLRHHEGGVEMALYADRYAHVPAVRGLAGRIILAQTQELSLMANLLRAYHVRPLPFAPSQALVNSDAGRALTAW
jgi:uncharacterized protein (DUF305 family)